MTFVFKWYAPLKWHISHKFGTNPWNLYICDVPTHMYQCWHCRWCHFTPHHLMSPCFYALLFFLNFWSWNWVNFPQLFFLLKTFFRDFATTFLLFSNVACISSLVFLTLACGFCGFSFWWTNIYLQIFANIRASWHVSLSRLSSLTYFYHQSSSLHKLLYIICARSTFFPFFCLHQCDGILIVKICHFISLINHKYDCKVFHEVWQTQTFCIPLISCRICGCNFTIL